MPRLKVGQVYKAQNEEGKPLRSNYIKFEKDVNLKAGDYLQVESKAYKIASAKAAAAAGKLSEEQLAEVLERAEKIPDFVLSELILVTR